MTHILVVALATIGGALAYLAIAYATARHTFRLIRPYTQPLSCDHRDLHGRTWHSRACYQRPLPASAATTITDAVSWTPMSSRGEAARYATLTGLLWPVVALMLTTNLALRSITARQPELPAERDHRLANLPDIRHAEVTRDD